MSRYNFKSLSSQDFEELVRDLLQAEWNVALEAFKTGRDSGIDLRYAHAAGGAIIIQCKHFAGSGFGKLLAHLRNNERPKVERLNPKRYVVVTSVGLTPANKDEVVNGLAPFILSARDVLGADDLEGLLSRHPGVERVHFKLWLTSTAVLERVLHNAELCQTDFEVERIRRKLPLFVKNDAFPRAIQLLDQTQIVVISGVPGIGKTTLAEMLLYTHLEQGYEPVVIQAEISEGKNLFKPNAKQIFYYDDFLGQIFLGDHREYLGRNQDVAIVDFMEMVRQTGHARFILTTREHILRGALQVSERLAHSPMLEHHCVLELEDYSYEQRARILYNHLYFSELPQPYKDAVLENDFFLEIIKHKHFNPRIIEWLSTYARLREVHSDGYRTHITALLVSPETIWAHAFQKQISDAARHLLLCFYTMGEQIETKDLEPAFVSFHRYSASKYQQRIAPGDFLRSLKELDGAFLSYSSDQVSYLNPSIREFIASVISSDHDIAEDLLRSVVRFKQVVMLWRLSTARPNSYLKRQFTSNSEILCDPLSRLLNGPSTRWEKMRDGSLRGFPIDLGVESKIRFLVEVAESLESTPLAELACQLAANLIASWDHHVPDFQAVIRLLKEFGDNAWFLAHGGREDYRRLLDGLLEELDFAVVEDWSELLTFPENALEWAEADESRMNAALQLYRESGVHDEIGYCTTVDEMIGLRDALDELSTKYGLDFKHEIESLDQDIYERERSDYEFQEGSGFTRGETSMHREAISDEDVRQMFSTLHENN